MTRFVCCYRIYKRIALDSMLDMRAQPNFGFSRGNSQGYSLLNQYYLVPTTYNMRMLVTLHFASQAAACIPKPSYHQ